MGSHVQGIRKGLESDSSTEVQKVENNGTWSHTYEENDFQRQLKTQ